MNRREPAAARAVEDAPTFRGPKVILPVPTPSPQFQHVQAGVPDTQLTREATGLLREFSTPLLFNHSHRVLFWGNELGRQTGKTFDAVGPPRRRDRPPPRSHPRVRRPRRLEYRISLLRRLAELAGGARPGGGSRARPGGGGAGGAAPGGPGPGAGG